MLAKNVNRETESQTSDTDNQLPTKFDLSIWSDNSDTANTHSITNSNLKKNVFFTRSTPNLIKYSMFVEGKNHLDEFN